MMPWAPKQDHLYLSATYSDTEPALTTIDQFSLKSAGIFFHLAEAFHLHSILTFFFSGLSFSTEIHVGTRASASQKYLGLNLGTLSA